MKGSNRAWLLGVDAPFTEIKMQFTGLFILMACSLLCRQPINYKFEKKPMEDQKYRSWNGRIWSGLLLLIVGSVLLLQRLGVYFPYWLFKWPMLLIIVGILIAAGIFFPLLRNEQQQKIDQLQAQINQLEKETTQHQQWKKQDSVRYTVNLLRNADIQKLKTLKQEINTTCQR
ncbi:MAG: DUF5668 domain-containing protein [Chitinophagaceae bacterium]